MDKLLFPPEIVQIYDDYLSDTILLEATRKPTDGLMGFGKGSGSDACHDRFSERLEQALNDIAANEPSSEKVLAVLRFVFEAPIEYRDNKLGYWMLQAVHVLTDRLICFLSPEDAADLALFYTETYPKSVRLPAQKKIFAHLKEQAGGSFVQKKKSLIERLRGTRIL